MNVEELRQKLSSSLLIPLGAGAAVAAFTLSPLVGWIDPLALATWGAIGAVGIGLVLAAIHAADTQRRLALYYNGGFALILVSMLGTGLNVNAMQGAMGRWRAQCEALQADMMLLHPHRPDGPALFSALGCKPTAETRLQFSDRPVDATR